MSSSNDARPVVVLTAGGVGSNKSKSKKKSTTVNDTTTAPPEGRESRDSVLDQEEGDEVEAPFVDEPVVSRDENEEANSRALAQGSNAGVAGKSAVTSQDRLGGRVSSTGSAAMTSLQHSKSYELLWLLICFLGIMASFVCYGLLLEYATSGGRKLHELSFLFVTSGLYTITAAAGRYVRDETPTTIPPARFAVLGLTSMGSTFFSVRSLR